MPACSPTPIGTHWFADRSDHLPLVATVLPPEPRRTGPLTVDESLLVKVRKLLAKAESTTEPERGRGVLGEGRRARSPPIASTRPGRATGALERGSSCAASPLGRGAYVRARLALLSAVGREPRLRARVRDRPRRHGRRAVGGLRRPTSTSTALLYESLHIQAATQMAAVRRA